MPEIARMLDHPSLMGAPTRRQGHGSAFAVLGPSSLPDVFRQSSR